MRREFFNKIEAALSAERLRAYGQDEPAPAVVMGRYLWNTALCQTPYAPLQMCEVVLRNAIHAAMTSLHTENWYDAVSLTPFGYKQVGDVKNKIAKSSRPVTPSRVVAGLHFAFWTGMFEDHYARHTDFLPAGIKMVFPRLAKSQHNRKDLKARLESIRQLRNRVFHHERIVHWKDLADQHARIIETIDWISFEAAEMSLKLDRFLETYRRGVDPWVAEVRNHWPATSPPGDDAR